MRLRKREEFDSFVQKCMVAVLAAFVGAVWLIGSSVLHVEGEDGAWSKPLEVYRVESAWAAVRTEPSLDAPVVRLAQRGERLIVFESRGNWAMVSEEGEPEEWVKVR